MYIAMYLFAYHDKVFGMFEPFELIVPNSHIVIYMDCM